MKQTLLTLSLGLAAACIDAAPLDLKPGDHVVLLGNSLAERMQHDGWLETYVQAAVPESEIVFRNHGFSGDKVNDRPRNAGFIDADSYLEISEADVLLVFFGYNESYDETPEAYTAALIEWIDATMEKRYNGESAPRIALMAPIAHEDFGDPNLPDGRANNRRLLAYANATAEAAKARGIPYVDLYNHSAALYAAESEPLTINGVHLNSLGNQRVGQHIASTLFGVELEEDSSRLEAIRADVVDKNWYWFNRYRATDGNDVWGGRSHLKFVDDQTNREVLMHELNMIDVMTANRDGKVWATAQGEPYTVDDSNVPAPVQVISNVGGGSRSSNAQKEGNKAYMSPEETADQLVLPEALDVNVFASEEMFPELANPVQMAVDTKGRLWAAAWKTYPKWEPLKEMEDRLLILPDDDRDGVADRAITFAKVHNPTGFEFWNGGVLVASVPDILFLKDTDGDDVADYQERVLHGLDSADTHHSANAFVYGPDGHLYYQRGVFHVSNVESPWTAAQKSTTSGMYRFNPRTFAFSFHAVNSPNPHGISFNYWGYQFATDGTGGNAFQVRPSSDGGFKMQRLLNKTVRPVPASSVISSPHFPKEYQEDFVILNSIGFLGIKQYDIDIDEAGNAWGEETQELLKSPADRNFRPTDFEIGSDGAMYVSDWQNIIVGHMQHNIRDPSRDHEYGRVFRITHKGRPLMPFVAVDGRPIPALLDLLTDPTNITRYRARLELSERDTEEVMAALEVWTAQWDPENADHAHHLLEALWLCQQHNVENTSLLDLVLNSPVGHARIAAETVRHFWNQDPSKVTPAAEVVDEGPKAVMTPVATLKDRGLSDEDIELYALGSEVFLREGHCATCHQVDGAGLPGLYPPIQESAWVTGSQERLIKITLKGLWGELDFKGFKYNGPNSTTPPMTPFRALLDDREVAGVLTYVRNTFGNEAPAVAPATVTRVSESVAGKTTFYMVDEILKEHPLSEE